MQDSRLRWTLGTLISLLVLTTVLFFYPDAHVSKVAPHPDYPSILQSTAQYDSTGAWLAVIFGLMLIAVMTLTMLVGLNRPNHKSKFAKVLLRVVVVYALVWVCIKLANDSYMAGNSNIIIGGFPLPTALLMYGMGIFPLVMLPFYYRFFDRDIYSDADQEEFEAILKKYNAGGEK
ncbi:MAG: hypothetical protein AAF564_20895 [Bacteroidota bacterium]